MAYLLVSDFITGMDRRRPQSVGVPGSLWTLKNALVSRGGDIIRSKKFDLDQELPAGTFGLYALKGQLWVFGSASTPVGLPVAVQYQQLAAPGTPAMTAVLDVKAFDGKLYVIAEYDDGSVYHYYNGTRVSSWDTVVETATVTASDVARRLGAKIDVLAAVSAQVSGAAVIVTAATPGTAFTISGSATDGGSDTSEDLVVSTLQANVAAVAEVRATGSVTITGGSSGPGTNHIEDLTIDGVSVIDEPIDWATSNAATALLLANAVNNGTETHGYTASVVSATVTLTAAVGEGATVNGDVVAVTLGGTVSASTADISGGVTEVAAVAQVSKVLVSGTIEVEDTFSVTVNGTEILTTGMAAGMGTAVLVHKKRLWSLTNVLRYCQLNDPTDWTDATASVGAGFIAISSDSDGAQDLVALGTYQGNLAIFAREAIIIYSIDTDSDNNAYVETVENTGTIASRSVVSFGNLDLFYLDATGVRSLRARQGTNAAYKSDIGETIDPFVQDLIDEVGETATERAQAIIDPRDSRYLLAIGRYIVALSYYPDSKVRAWSYIDFEASISNIVRSKREVYIRAGDDIYRYGGTTGAVYPDADEFEAVAETPFMDAKDPAARKMLNGFDMACSGEWNVELLTDPNDTSKSARIGRINKNTYHLPRIEIPGETTHVAFRFTADKAGYASLSSLAIHFVKGKAE